MEMEMEMEIRRVIVQERVYYVIMIDVYSVHTQNLQGRERKR